MDKNIRRVLPRILAFWVAGAVAVTLLTLMGAPAYALPLAAAALAVLILRR